MLLLHDAIIAIISNNLSGTPIVALIIVDYCDDWMYYCLDYCMDYCFPISKSSIRIIRGLYFWVVDYTDYTFDYTDYLFENLGWIICDVRRQAIAESPYGRVCPPGGFAILDLSANQEERVWNKIWLPHVGSFTGTLYESNFPRPKI